MTGMQAVAFRQYNANRSVDVNFSPTDTMAEISLCEVGGQGLHYVGILSYRHRPQPSGAEQVVNFSGHFYNQPSLVFVNNMTSVTFQLTLGGEQSGKALANVFFWS